jgi:hypothetical protein
MRTHSELRDVLFCGAVILAVGIPLLLWGMMSLGAA